ncbi:MAG: hypothetical protein KJ606_00105 [Chloroflexi bacterium]|nr:hypothetical protein [Chloroflexota bacterium]
MKKNDTPVSKLTPSITEGQLADLRALLPHVFTEGKVDFEKLRAALAQWPAGRTRLALGGWGRSPLLAMDGNEAEGLESAARNAYHEATDEWASSEYRMDVAAVLAKRCLEEL